MAKNNFKAKEAVNDPNYAGGIGQMGQGAAQTGVQQQGEGFGALRDTLGQQKSFADMLQSAAAGTGGPTMADQQIKDATARNNANAAGFAAGAKGLNPALAARQALMAQAGNNQQAAGQAAQTRVQEQLAARAQLGGALQGQAATAGGMTSAGQGMLGTGGGLANQSNQNLINSRQGANQINADVAKQNAGAINGMIGGVMNAAGGAFGLAEGGVVPGEPEGTQNDETSIALAKGGSVPSPRAMPTSAPHAAGAAPHRSFAAQVAHHLSREYFAEGGMAQQPGASDWGMDLRDAKPQPKRKPKSEGGASTTMFIPHDYSPSSTPTQGKEGTDSEGNEKPSINRAYGGDVSDDDIQDEEEEQSAEQDQGQSEEEYAEHFFADGGDVAAGGGDESAGLNMDRHQAAAAADTKQHPSAFQRLGAGLQGLAGGMAPGAIPFSQLKPIPSNAPAPMDPHLANATGKRLATGGPRKLALNVPVKEPGGAIAPIVPGDAQAVSSIYASGGPVPGKAPVPGNSLKNDVVDAKLSPGEVVLPRTIAHDPEKAKRFVEHLMQHGGSGHDALSAIKKRKA